MSQPSSVVFACKTAHFGPELQVSMGPRPHLWFWAHITACLAQESKDYIGSSTHLGFCACKTWTLGLELHDSVGQRPHLLFLHAKLRLLDQNNKSLWVPDHTCCFYMLNCDFWTRITSLYGSQTWPVLLCMYNSVLNIRITSLYGSPPSWLLSGCKAATFGP